MLPPGWTSSFSGNAVQGNGIKMSNGEAAVANVLRIPAGNVIEANIHLTRLGVGALLFGGDFRGNTIIANYPLFSAATANQIDNAIALAFNGVTRRHPSAPTTQSTQTSRYLFSPQPRTSSPACPCSQRDILYK